MIIDYYNNSNQPTTFQWPVAKLKQDWFLKLQHHRTAEGIWFNTWCTTDAAKLSHQQQQQHPRATCTLMSNIQF